jgi:hypothetical protein
MDEDVHPPSEFLSPVTAHRRQDVVLQARKDQRIETLMDGLEVEEFDAPDGAETTEPPERETPRVDL